MAQIELAWLQQTFAKAPFVADVGIEPLSGETGLVVARLLILPRHRQQTGVVHLGAITTLADHTAGAAAWTTIPPGKQVVTAHFEIHLLRGATGQELRAVARVVKPGRTLIFAECEVFDRAGDGAEKLAAKTSAILAVV